jgi:hypothetical protein
MMNLLDQQQEESLEHVVIATSQSVSAILKRSRQHAKQLATRWQFSHVNFVRELPSQLLKTPMETLWSFFRLLDVPIGVIPFFA